jgi:hypothetical protein
MDRLRVDYSRIVALDVPRYRTRLPNPPPRRGLGTIERAAVGGAIDVAAHVSSFAALLKDVKEIAATARRVPLSFIGGSGPMIAAPASVSVITIGVGATASAFMVIGVTYGAGLYGSNSPELGVYTSPGAGIWTNAGVSGGFQLTYVFGPPSSFGGLSWGVAVSADMPGVGVGLSAMVILSASGPPYQLLGWSVGVGGGVSVLPVDISFQVSNTRLTRLTP